MNNSINNKQAMKFKRYKNEEGCYEWSCGMFRIIRGGGVDRLGHFTYDLGYYGLEKDGELRGWVRTLSEAKEYASTINSITQP